MPIWYRTGLIATTFLNPSKCKFMLISCKRNRMNYPSCYNHQWPNTGNCPYLLLSSDLSWTNNIERTCTIAKKILGLLYRQFYQHADQETLTLQLYISHCLAPHGVCSTSLGPTHEKRSGSTGKDSKFVCKMITKNQDKGYNELL